MNNKLLIVGIFLTSFLLLMTFFGPYLPFIDRDLEGGRLYFPPPPGKLEKAPFPPSERHLLGSDRDGVDLLSLLVVGAKETVVFIIGVALLRYVIAIPLGMLGYKNRGFFSWVTGGWNSLFSSMPSNLMIIIILNLPFLLYSDERYVWSFLIIALFDVGRVSYLIQQQSYHISKKPYIETAITIGVKPLSRLKNHYLPVLFPEIITNFCLDIGRIALLIGQLGILNIFLNQDLVQMSMGFSEIVQTSHDWPSIMSDTRKDFHSAFWIPFYPALAITFLIVSFTILGEGLRKHYNRHIH